MNRTAQRAPWDYPEVRCLNCGHTEPGGDKKAFVKWTLTNNMVLCPTCTEKRGQQ